MKKRYWYDLSDKEQERLDKEWKNSKWYEAILNKRKKIKINSSQHSILTVFGIISMIIVFIIGMNYTMVSDDLIEDEAIPYFIWMGAFYFIGMTCIIGAIIEERKIKCQYVEEQKEKWLLEKHDIMS